MAFEQLERERKRRKVSRKALCKEMGISQASYSNKITGKNEFTRKEIQVVMDVLGLETPMGIFFRAGKTSVTTAADEII